MRMNGLLELCFNVSSAIVRICSTLMIHISDTITHSRDFRTCAAQRILRFGTAGRPGCAKKQGSVQRLAIPFDADRKHYEQEQGDWP